MDRKTFIRKSSTGLLIGIPVLSMISSCSSSDDDGGVTPPQDDPQDPIGGSGNCLENGTNSSISANHGHSMTVSKQDVEAGVEKTYTLSEASTNQHTHRVTLSSSQFNSLKGNQSITATSTSDSGHTHSVTVSCA